MILNVVGNLLLIPKYGCVGASIATVATVALGNALNLHFVSKLVCRAESYTVIVRPAVACALLAGSLILLQHLNLFLAVPIAAMIYVAVLVLLKTFAREDLDLFKQIGGEGGKKAKN
jgi:O-antigen/teichoic acid export membrane protein